MVPSTRFDCGNDSQRDDFPWRDCASDLGETEAIILVEREYGRRQSLGSLHESFVDDGLASIVNKSALWYIVNSVSLLLRHRSLPGLVVEIPLHPSQLKVPRKK